MRYTNAYTHTQLKNQTWSNWICFPQQTKTIIGATDWALDYDIDPSNAKRTQFEIWDFKFSVCFPTLSQPNLLTRDKVLLSISTTIAIRPISIPLSLSHCLQALIVYKEILKDDDWRVQNRRDTLHALGLIICLFFKNSFGLNYSKHKAHGQHP